MAERRQYDGVSGAQLPELAWQQLQLGVSDRKHPFHTPVLATGGGAGVEVRTVVLRWADPAHNYLHCHTDVRSPKVKALAEDNRVSWLFYDPAMRLQLRVKGQATIHHQDQVAKTGWDNSTADSRECYRHRDGPGFGLEQGGELPIKVDADGFENFAVFRCKVQVIEWLFLRYSGHQRCRLDWVDGHWQHQWLAP